MYIYVYVYIFPNLDFCIEVANGILATIIHNALDVKHVTVFAPSRLKLNRVVFVEDLLLTVDELQLFGPVQPITQLCQIRKASRLD